jgi:AcrR family transcriptional regulator
LNIDVQYNPAMPAVPHLRPSRRRIHAAAMRLFAEKGTTQLAISELAEAAGVARGTIYNHQTDGPALFHEVAEHLVAEMSARMAKGFEEVDDMAMRMALGVRFYVRRAHQEPDWGRFVTRFAYNSTPLQRMWEGGPGDNLRRGIEQRRYPLRRSQLRAALGMIVGGVLSAMSAVLDGDLTWRAAGSDTAELLLAALGIARDEARRIASVPLPALPPVS